MNERQSLVLEDYYSICVIITIITSLNLELSVYFAKVDIHKMYSKSNS